MLGLLQYIWAGDKVRKRHIGVQIERRALQGMIAVHPLVYHFESPLWHRFLRAVSTFGSFAVYYRYVRT